MKDFLLMFLKKHNCTTLLNVYYTTQMIHCVIQANQTLLCFTFICLALCTMFVVGSMYYDSSHATCPRITSAGPITNINYAPHYVCLMLPYAGEVVVVVVVGQRCLKRSN